MLLQTWPFSAIDRFGDRAVGVDGVAAVDEEQRAALAHRLVDLHAAERRVDPPALARRVAAPHEAQIAARMTRPRRSSSSPIRSSGGTTNRPVTGSPIARSLFRLWNETRTNTSLPGFEALEILPRREVGRLQRVRADQALHLAEPLVVRPFDQHARRPIAAAPDHDRAVAGIAERQALQRTRVRDQRGEKASGSRTLQRKRRTVEAGSPRTVSAASRNAPSRSTARR